MEIQLLDKKKEISFAKGISDGAEIRIHGEVIIIIFIKLIFIQGSYEISSLS